jgi:hypothetical protein
METSETNNDKQFICIVCNFSSSKKNHYIKHCTTIKHKQQIQTHIKENVCINCNKLYKTRSGLWKHSKTCKSFVVDNNLIFEVIGQNKEFQEKIIADNQDFKEQIIKQQSQLIELASKPGTVNNNNTTNTTTNTRVNINVFLNDTCKNAINVSDFYKSINITVEDLENTGKHGYVAGITTILTRELSELDITKRPIHCSDVKRKTIYIKDNDVWEKDNEKNTKMKKVIDKVSNKSLDKINDWAQEHPNYQDYYSKENDEYTSILINNINSESDADSESNYNKIIKEMAIITKV